MTKQEFIENWIGGTIFPENLNRDLDLLIQQAIADHDADTKRLDKLQSLTKGYGKGWVLRDSSNGRGMRLHETSLDNAVSDVRTAIDLFELPAPFQEGGE